MRAITARRVLRADELHGIGNDAAERAVRTGRWQRPAYGVYLTSSDPPSDRDLTAIARAYVREPFVITGLLALRAFELRWLPDLRGIDVLVPPDNRQRSSGLVRVSRAGRFDELDSWVQAGVRLAMPDRAVIDAARSLHSLRDVRGVVLGAVADRKVSIADLSAALATGRRNNSRHARRAIRDAARGCASPPEAELVDQLVGRGTPFYVNPQLWLDDVVLGSPDVWVVGTGTGGEVDSQERHGDDEGVENTYDRHERFSAPGLQLVHLSVGRIRRDAGEAAEHLLARARVGPPPPVGLRVVPAGPLLR